MKAPLESGKWVDASVQFSGVTEPGQLPEALARIVNQYIAEHAALHDRPAREIIEACAEQLAPWGVLFEANQAVVSKSPASKAYRLKQQFVAAWSRCRTPQAANR